MAEPRFTSRFVRFVLAVGVSVAALGELGNVAEAAPPAPFNSCSSVDLPGASASPARNSLIVDGQMNHGEEANYLQPTSSGGYKSPSTTVSFRSVANPDSSYGTTSFAYYTGTSSLAANTQVNYWNSPTVNDPFYFTAASSDLPNSNAPSGSPYARVVPKCVGDTALRMANAQGLYVHELVASLSAPAYNWSAGVASISSSGYWQTLDYWAQLAQRLNKKLVWSEPALGWEALANDATAKSYFHKWGATLVPMFATNFDSAGSGRKMGISRQWAAKVAADNGTALGESIQSWNFREQPDLAAQTGLPTTDATGASPGGGAGSGYLLDPMNTNDYVVGGIHYGNPVNQTPTNHEPSVVPTEAATQALAKFGSDQGATFFQIEGVRDVYQVAGKGSYGPINDLSWPLSGTPSSYLKGIQDFAATQLANNPAPTTPPKTTPLYQLWNANAVSHYYTTRDNGSGIPLGPGGSTVPACTDSGSTNGDYCYQEPDTSGIAGHLTNGITGYVATSPGTGLVALQAYKNAANGYFYKRANDTAHAVPSGYTVATSVSPAGNGVVGYVSSVDTPGTEPFYWMREDGTQVSGAPVDFFYTTDAAYERPGSLASFYIYHDLGVNSYLFTYGPAPVVSPPAGPSVPGEETGGDNPSENDDCLPCQGDPVDTATGAFVDAGHDLVINGRGPGLVLNRTYDSTASAVAGRFGYGWRDSYDMRVYAGTGVMSVRQENGSVDTFTANSDGTYSPPARVDATLTWTGSQWSFVRNGTGTFLFAGDGSLVKEKDLDGNSTTLTYAGGNLTTVTDSAGRTLTFTYTGSNVTKVTDSAGRATSYTYSGSGELATATSLTGGVTAYQYTVASNGQHQLVTETDPVGEVTKNVYDTSGRVTSQTVCTVTTNPCPTASQRTTSWSYATDPAYNGTTTVTDPTGIVTQYNYAAGVLTSEIDAYGTSSASVSSYVNDPSTGKVTSSTDGNGHTSTFTYDSAGNKVSATDPLGRVTQWTYNRWHQVTSIVKPMTYGGHPETTTMTYDEPAYSQNTGAGNLTTVSQTIYSPAGAVSGVRTVHYVHGDSAHPGDVTSQIDANGNTWTMTYDSYGDRLSLVSPATTDHFNGVSQQSTQRWTYNTIGWILSRESARWTGTPSSNPCTEPAIGCTVFTYDAAGRALTSVDGNNHKVVTTYDADGRKLTQQDAAGLIQTSTYDAAGELLSTKAPNGSLTTYTYDGDGNQTTLTDANGSVTQHSYDPLGRPATRTDPKGRVTRYKFDPVGNLVAQGDANVSSCDTNSTAAGCTVYVYDGDDEQTAVHYHDAATPDVTRTYDADGRRTGMTDGSGTSSWTFDSVGDVLSTTDGAGAVTSFSYDASAHVLTTTYPQSVGVVKRSYDAAGRISQILDWKQGQNRFLYDADGNIISTYDGVATSTTSMPDSDEYTYDAADQITRLVDANANRQLTQFDYTTDASNHIKTANAFGAFSESHSYGLDGDGRLSTVDGSTAFGYDAGGRPTTIGGTSQAFDTADQITSVTIGAATSAFTYDANGNRLTGSAPGQAANHYAYNRVGQMISATPASGTVYTYAYNGDGLRTSKQAGSAAVERFTWDTVEGANAQILQDGTTSYIYAPDGSPLEQMDGSGAILWFHHDRLGSTRLLTDVTGAAVGQQSYSPSGALTSTSGVRSHLGFDGQYEDVETGFIYLRARYFDPASDQFTTVDPAFDATGTRYGYAGDDPTDADDPSGLGWSIYVLTHDGVPYYVGKTTQQVRDRFNQHALGGRVIKDADCDYTVVAKDIADNVSASSIEETVMEVLGLKGGSVEVNYINSDGVESTATVKRNVIRAMSRKRFASENGAQRASDYFHDPANSKYVSRVQNLYSKLTSGAGRDSDSGVASRNFWGSADAEEQVAVRAAIPGGLPFPGQDEEPTGVDPDAEGSGE